ncbi:MAG TPA: winged helix-turn-helix domain-containing protein [Aliidongia sp.]|nr:winged helix-turn-helix domain-containing protein [Aliidongia sp.]
MHSVFPSQQVDDVEIIRRGAGPPRPWPTYNPEPLADLPASSWPCGTLAASSERYDFASFQLYPKQRTLLRGSEPVAIGGRAFDLLLLLVSQAGRIISASDLISSLWPNLTVEESNLRVQMAMLRKILSQCDKARRAVETISLRGYCFILPVLYHPDGTGLEMRKPSAHTTLPTLLNPILGREDAIEIIRAALDKWRLVTVTGPGGIGKTTAAIETANRYAATFQGTIVFVDLSHIVDGAEATLAIAEALGIKAQGDALAALCEYLVTRDLLLILDTCEHIVESVAKLTEVLLAHCAMLRLLVTSREALRAAGEWTHRLPSLTFPAEGEEIDEANLATFSAITLFVDRVRSSMRFEVEHDDLPLLAEICRRLDGIPLALEFAAARVADLGLRTIAAHLDDRFSILTRGRRTALPRHRTLSAALDWSYSLLSNEEQCMLRHLATLGGTFGAEHAIAAAGNAGCQSPREALSGLYEKSLLTVDMRHDTPIYYLLDTTRAYVAGVSAD